MYVLRGCRREEEGQSRNEDGTLDEAQETISQTIVHHNSRLGRKTSRGEDREQSRGSLLKKKSSSLSARSQG